MPGTSERNGPLARKYGKVSGLRPTWTITNWAKNKLAVAQKNPTEQYVIHYVPWYTD